MSPLPVFAGVVPTLVAQAGEGAPAAAAPNAAPSTGLYLWSARKAEDGSIALEGDVPSDDTRQTLLDSIGGAVSDATQLASGEPDDFSTNAVSALGILADLDSGRVAYDGTGWSVTGKVDSPDKAVAAQAAFNASPLKGLGTSYSVEAPSTAAAQPSISTPAATPSQAGANGSATAALTANYAWSAEKAGDGTITFNGSVPTTALKNVLAERAGSSSIDESVVTTGAPSDFVGGALYGLAALQALQSGKLLFAGGEWSLAGLAKEDAAETAAHSALSVIDTSHWRFDIRTPVSQAVAEAPANNAEPPSQPAAQGPAQSDQPTPANNADEAAAPPASAAPPPSTTAPNETATVAAQAAPASAPTPYTFTAQKAADGTVVLSGEVPTPGAGAYFADLIGKADASKLEVVPHAPDGFVAGALAGLPLLAHLASGELRYDGTNWTLQGSAATLDVRKSVLDAVAALPTGKSWTADIQGPSPLQICQTDLASFLAGNNIVFLNRTTFAKGTDVQFDALAKVLAACPDVKVDIEAHTDSDGDAKANLALSVARAEAVQNELVKRGIAPGRLYAVGYGETLPLVPNTTKANKAKNRRIEIKLQDPSIPG